MQSAVRERFILPTAYFLLPTSSNWSSRSRLVKMYSATRVREMCGAKNHPLSAPQVCNRIETIPADAAHFQFIANDSYSKGS